MASRVLGDAAVAVGNLQFVKHRHSEGVDWGSSARRNKSENSIEPLGDLCEGPPEYLWAGRGGVCNENIAPASAAPGSTTSTGVGFGVLGYRAEFSNNVAGNLTKGASAAKCSAALFGNWSDLLIGEWGVLEILPNPYASGVYEAGEVQVRAMQTIDVAVRHAESFVVMKDALTA